MKQQIAKILLLFALLLLPLTGWSQKRIYTRSVQIQDFKSKTTKVVLGQSPEFDEALRAELTSLWSASPYEFCTRKDYEKQKNSSDCYFLHTETEKGIIYLTLSRGGKKDAGDALSLPVTVLSMPIAGANDTSGSCLTYLPAYIILVQDFVEKAVNSEYVAYTGLKAIREKKPKGVKVYTDPAEALEAFDSQYVDAAAQIVITPDGNPKSKPRFRMIIDTSSYALYHYGKN